MITIITNGRLLDCIGNEPLENASVVIEDGVIKEVYTGKKSLSNDATVIDVGGKTIMPGLTDAHEHPMSTELNPAKAGSESLLYKVLGMKSNLEQILQAGFTTVRDTGGAHWSAKQATEDGVIKGPRLQISCAILSTTGGHGDPNLHGEQVFHGDTGRLFKWGRTCDGVDDCRKAAREQFRSGADFIKLCATGGCASPNDEPWHLQFSEPELRAIVEEARAVGLYVAAHCEEDNGARRAVECGARTIEHGFFLSEETARLMKEKGAYLVTTLAIAWWILTYGKQYGASEWLLRKVKEPRGPGQPDSLEAMVIGMKNARKAGVPVGSGADYISSKMFGTEAMELKLKVEHGGLTPYEAIKSATIVNAEVMRLKDKIGSVEPGKWADIIAVEGKPDENINVLTEPANIKLVMKKGGVFKNIG